MALLHVNFYSRTLERETQMDVILPEAAKKLIGMEGVATRQCKTLYLLHGMSDDQTVWQRRTSIERYAAAYGLAVVMPTTDLGWYTDRYVPGRQVLRLYHPRAARRVPRSVSHDEP